MDDDNPERGELEMKSGYPSSGDQRFEDLRHEGKFLEAFVYAWGMVESDVDQSVLNQFGLLTSTANLHPKRGDEKVKYVLHTSFERKLGFLERMKVLIPSNRKALCDFADMRNELLHGGNYSMRAINLTQAEKETHLNLAARALRIGLYPQVEEKKSRPLTGRKRAVD